MSGKKDMVAIPDDLLSSIAGGVLDEASYNRIEEITFGWRDNGVPRDVVVQLWQGWAKDHAEPDDWPQVEEIIVSAYGA